MEIRNNAEALKAFLGITSPEPAQTKLGRTAGTAASQVTLAGDQATLSQAASEVSQAVMEAEVGTEKVAAIQQALAAGTYSVPASKVADKMIDAMLTGGFGATR